MSLDRQQSRRLFAFIALLALTACQQSLPEKNIAPNSTGAGGGICHYHDGINAMDVYGNDMYVRCNDGTVLTQ